MSEEASKEFNELTTCQNCGKADPNLSRIDSGLKLTLTKMGRADIPLDVCAACMKELRGSASLGAQLQAKEELKANHAGKLWKTRVGLVKQGRLFLQRGDYSQSAVSYEKYLKILAVVTKKKGRNELDPKDFNDQPKEITIISSVLWDLMLIYDANAKFGGKQTETAELLSKFLRFSPVYNSIIRRAEKEVRKSKNPQAFMHLLRLCDVHASRCFIANESFGSRIHPTVITLCQFRDVVLRQSPMGRQFIAWYYRTSPTWAEWLKKHPHLKTVLRPVLRGVGILLQTIFRLPVRPIS